MATQAEKFTHLLRVLENVKNNCSTNFNIREWFGIDTMSDQAIEEFERQLNNSPRPWTVVQECGTTACACGYASLDPWFTEQGFIHVLGSIEYHPPGGTVFLSWEAIQEFFDISDITAEWLFSSYGYNVDPTIHDVIEQVKQFVANDYKNPSL